MDAIANTSDASLEAVKQARQDYVESQAKPQVYDSQIEKSFNPTSELPNCWDFDRYAHHLR